MKSIKLHLWPAHCQRSPHDPVQNVLLTGKRAHTKLRQNQNSWWALGLVLGDFWEVPKCPGLLQGSTEQGKVTSGRNSAQNSSTQTSIPGASRASTWTLGTAGAALKTPNGWHREHFPHCQTQTAAAGTNLAMGKCQTHQRSQSNCYFTAFSSQDWELHLLSIPASRHL